MSNILIAKVSIRGIRPILWHAFGPDSISLDKRKERTGVAGNDPEEWRKTVLMTAERQLFLKPTYVFGCIRDGAKHTKRGRGSIQALVASTLQVLDDVILLDRFVPEEPIPTDPTAPVFLDVSGVKNPATKSRNVRYRIAASKGWQCAFNIMWDSSIVSRNELEAITVDSGALCGLGDGRSIGFGRFALVSFSVAEK